MEHGTLPPVLPTNAHNRRGPSGARWLQVLAAALAFVACLHSLTGAAPRVAQATVEAASSAAASDPAQLLEPVELPAFERSAADDPGELDGVESGEEENDPSDWVRSCELTLRHLDIDAGRAFLFVRYGEGDGSRSAASARAPPAQRLV